VNRCFALVTAILVLGSGGTRGLRAQGPPAVELNHLRTPTSPAFVILGIEPTSVERPTTPRAFALSFLSASDNATVIPRDYAVEVAPYWLYRHPLLTFDQYYRPTLAQAVAQTTTFSFATAHGSETGDSAATSVGFGLRTTPVGGRPTRALDNLVGALDTLQRRRIPLVRAAIDADDVVTEAEEALSQAHQAGDSAAIAELSARLAQELRPEVERLQQQLDAQSDTMRLIVARMEQEERERVGLVLQLAAGVATVFPGNAFSAGEISRYGAWSTLTYRLEDPKLDFIALARFQQNRAGDGQGLWDAGGRIHWTQDRFGLSAEFVNRTALDVDVDSPGGGVSGGTFQFETSRRIVGMLEYRASDDLYVTASFGQDYERAGEDQSPVVAILGLNLHLGEKPRLLVPMSGR
jgi:hypothetical protein